MTPYASVIIPTQSRAATLAATVGSVQRQSERDIEIVISGDGATAEVREISCALARADNRIRFLDQAKAPGRGGLNRDNAVRQARAERIFYTDDDDLWLSNHVATLGPLLDTADIADSLVASVGFSGTLHVSLVDNSDRASRESFAAGRGKTVFDTHLAHRKSAYFQVAQSWASGGPEVLFASFAAERTIRWRSIGEVTALSLHGARRAAMTNDARRIEIVHWFSRLEELEREGALSRAASAWWAYLTASARGSLAAPLPPFASITEEQRRHFDAAVSLATGRSIGERDWLPVFLQLLDRVVKDPPRATLADHLSRALGTDTALAILAELSNAEPVTAGRAALMSAHILLASGRGAFDVEAALGPALADEPLTRSEALLLLAQLRAPVSIEAAADLAEAAAMSAPRIASTWNALFDYALRANRPEAARTAFERLEILRIEQARRPAVGRLERMERILRQQLKRNEKALLREAKVAAKALKAQQRTAARHGEAKAKKGV